MGTDCPSTDLIMSGICESSPMYLLASSLLICLLRPSSIASMLSTATCAVKAFVLATPISGPTCRYMPASVARIAPADMKGTAMGLFSSAQFIGAFCGGVLGGVLLGAGDHTNTFFWLAAILGGWLLLALTMKPPAYLASRIVSLQDLDPTELQRFVDGAGALDGVREISIYEADRVAYLKVEKHFDDRELQALIGR